MSEQETHKLTVALTELAGKVDSNGKAMQMGFSEFRRELTAIKEAQKEHRNHCPDCRDGLQAEILTNEREARKREEAIAKAARDDNRALEVRVRALEKVRNLHAGAYAAAGALFGVFAEPVVKALIGRIL